MLLMADTNDANGKSANVNIVEAAMNVCVTQMRVLPVHMSYCKYLNNLHLLLIIFEFRSFAFRCKHNILVKIWLCNQFMLSAQQQISK